MNEKDIVAAIDEQIARLITARKLLLAGSEEKTHDTGARPHARQRAGESKHTASTAGRSQDAAAQKKRLASANKVSGQTSRKSAK